MTGIVVSIAILCLVLILFSRPRRRDGLAPEGGPRLKNLLAFLMARSGEKHREEWQSVELADGRVPVPAGVAVDMYNDSFVFQGADAEGNVFLTRLGFRNDGKHVEAWFWGTADGERYANDEREIFRDSDPAPDSVAGGGISYEKVGAGQWKIAYKGTLNGQTAAAELLWKADSALYFSPDHMNPLATGRAMAEMPWSREYFEKLRSEKQVRIEQGGILTGTVEFGGKTITLDMKGVRDHSWGKRDWNYINRYMWFMLALDEPTEICGIKAKYLAVTPADYGDSFRRITTGWIAGDTEVKPISYSTDLIELGQDGNIPTNYTVRFKTPDSKVVSIVTERTQPEMPWIQNNRGFEVNEAWAGVSVDGMKGFGIAEFGYSAERGFNRPFETGDEQ